MRLGVLGWPVAHSRSPAMFAVTGVPGLTYQLLPVPPELFDETVRALGPAGFHGANVTLPHKEAALAVATEASERARAIGAANTLTFEGDRIHADNTDAPGLLEALPFDPQGRSALVLGAGGTARAAVWALASAGARIRVWNRTAERARALAGEFGVELADAPAPAPADLLVNTTSVGLHDPAATFKDLPLDADALSEFACVVDFVYRPGGTALLRAAAERGAVVVDGLDILVRQGAISFTAWTGREAPIDAMRDAARAATTPRHASAPRRH
jgi:shikimate dehydrogenase